MAKAGQVRIGVSGWRYEGWRGVFYPDGLRQKDELSYLARQFATVEINGTFYSLQRPESFEAWSSETPADFVFAVKGSRYITHMLRLVKFEQPLANFFASGVLALGPKLGPILWQFPPNFRFNAEKLEAFYHLLPRDTEQAARLARRHDARVTGRAFLKPGPKRKLRHAMEIRHDSFIAPEFIKLLRKYRIGLVAADTVEWPLLMDLTSDFVYCRLHGSEELYASGYDDAALERWADRLAAWAKGSEHKDGTRVIDKPAPARVTRDVYVYFDNDKKVRAPFDAHSLIKKVDRRLGK
ncbi:DUF72 domain-containing protein [Dongia deserti]|uniref:DUF72 domain-containing protein n=1 Tax=Dongia deserti TaxID=2268030 RepID=UPI000E65BBD2|nr:DUF72 domain-containing protein [Dongia deserti]